MQDFSKPGILFWIGVPKMSEQQIALAVFLPIILLAWLALELSSHWMRDDEFKKQTLELGRQEFYSRFTIDTNVPTLLEDMINEIFDDYKALTLLPQNLMYINEEMERKICEDLGNMFAARISPEAMKKLATYYNEKMLAEKIISEKIFLIVTHYVYQVNSTAQNQSGIPQE